MKRFATVAATFTLTCFAQVSSVVSLSNGVTLRISADRAPLATELAPASGNSFYRMFRDENKLVVFAYEISVARTPDGEQFQITAKPAGDQFAAKFPNSDAGKPVPTLPAQRESPLLASGERFSIEVPTDPAQGGSLRDTIEVRLNRGGAGPSDSGTPSGGLRFAGLRVSINRVLASPARSGVIVAGRFAMFYIPGRGGYFFSTAPVDGTAFVEAGSVDRTHMQFTLENDVFECDAQAPILASSDRGQIWVYHDPHYEPAGNWTRDLTSGDRGRNQFFAAASDSLKWWLP